MLACPLPVSQCHYNQARLCLCSTLFNLYLRNPWASLVQCLLRGKHWQLACVHLQEYVELLASNMVEAQGDETSPAAGRVRGLVNELTGYACTMVKLNPEVMHTFFSRESNTGSAASLQWRHILVCFRCLFSPGISLSA